MLGCETDTYDREGARIRVAPWRHVTKEAVESMLDKFRGNIHQTPPMFVHIFGLNHTPSSTIHDSFSALKMDGKPLYEYARKGIPLPRPIEQRAVTVHSLELVEWLGSDHAYRWPDKEFTTEEKLAMGKALSSVEKSPLIDDTPGATTDQPPVAFGLSMKVSGGTYVRSIVHDLGHALDSAAHVVTLTRSRQGRFTLDPQDGQDKGCVPWDVFERARKNVGERDEDGYFEWEREVLDRLEVVESNKQV